ncbi:MAG TPA: penicillin-insensitive murein endopeptidase [Polyangiaceae bacterium]|nr:penicillin-insensitive murein endopeptidase [Polyangiaceae bacterium]
MSVTAASRPSSKPQRLAASFMSGAVFNLRAMFVAMSFGGAAAGCASAPSPLQPAQFGSVGVPNRGVLTGALELPASGAGYVRYRTRGQHHFGVPRLVRALERAAAGVQALAPGEPLVIGDLSARDGGRISGHNSHRTGRDVDLLYFATTPGGVPVRSPGFIPFEADGLAYDRVRSNFVRFDVDRVWLLIRGLLTDPEISVQFLFMSRPLETQVIDYAIARGEPLPLVYHAAATLTQPTDSLPHDDHLHVRVACTPEELLTGCSGGGPWWEWFPKLPPPPELHELEYLAIGSEDPLIEAPLPDTASASR